MTTTRQISGSAAATTTTQSNYPAYRGFRYEEDRGLEILLSGITVPRASGAMEKVAVFFKDPQREENRLTYPYFMIEYLDIRWRGNEQYRGYSMPYGYEAYTGNPLSSTAYGDAPIPIMLQYQVSTGAMNNQHDVMLNDILMTTMFPFQGGQIQMPSGTVRRLDVISGPRPQDLLTAESKRIFRKIWSIEISAEIINGLVSGIPVEELTLEVGQIGQPPDVTLHQ